MFATIGYEKAELEDFIATLHAGGIEVLVDIRDRAQSRRKGFSKTALATALMEAGIDYVHVKALGDPKEGRDAARAGLMDKFREVFASVLDSSQAQIALEEVKELAQSRTICLMCYERDHHVCHRKMVADELEKSLSCKALHLGVNKNDGRTAEARRVLHTCKSAAASF